ncbi:MAG: TM2 domain-containing protein [Fibromonadales bacterium]|nr:TM2 domain-containing protein [Fibromonadales bacterium]
MNYWGDLLEKSEKSKSIAVVLSIFLGLIGINRFYLGHIWTGIFKLILCLFFFIFIESIGGFFILIAVCWWISDICKTAKDKLVPIDIEKAMKARMQKCKRCGVEYDPDFVYSMPPYCSIHCQKMSEAGY